MCCAQQTSQQNGKWSVECENISARTTFKIHLNIQKFTATHPNKYVDTYVISNWQWCTYLE